MGSAQKVAAGLAEVPAVSTLTARYISTNADGTVRVDFGQGPVQVYSAGFYTPLPGDFVRTIKVDAFTMMLGPVVPKSAYGRVTATGTPNLTVKLPDGSSVSLPRVSSAYASPAVNDDVLINWANGGMVIGKVTAVPVSNYLPPATGGGGSGGSSFAVDFRADDSGTQNNGNASFWTADVWCGDSSTGGWFYGTALADTIPDGATITAVQVYVTEFYNGFPGALAKIGLHGLATKSGVLSVGSAVTVPDGTGWKSLPTSFGDALKTGAKLGLGTAHGGYHKYRSRSSDAQSGLLHIEWSI